MSDPRTGLASLGLDSAIRLRWALRDIHAKRLKLSPLAAEDLQILKDMGYVEIVEDEPVITLSGMDEMNLAD